MNLVIPIAQAGNPAVPNRDSLTTCDKASSYIINTGLISGVAGSIIASSVCNTVWLSFLIGMPTVACGVGYWYIRRYRQLKTINEVSDSVAKNADQITKTADNVNRLTQQELELQNKRDEADEKMQTHLSHINSAQADSIAQISQMQYTISSLSHTNEEILLENNDLKMKIEKLQKQIEEMKNLIETLHHQKEDIAHISHTMDTQLDRIQQQRQTLNKVSDHISTNVEHLSGTIESSQHEFLEAFKLYQEQNEALRIKVAELNEKIQEFQKLEQDLSPRLLEKQKLKKALKKATRKLKETAEGRAELSAIKARLSAESNSPHLSPSHQKESPADTTFYSPHTMENPYEPK